MRTERLSFHALLSVFVLALILRLAFLSTKPLAWSHQLQAGDEPLYHGLAVSLVHGLGYSLDGQPTARYGPGYPFFLSVIYRFAGIKPPAARIANALAGSLLCVLLAIFTASLWGAKAGVIAGILAALYYPFIQLPLYLITENLYLPLFVATALLTWKAVKAQPNSLWAAAFAGLSWGIASLTRAIALPLAILCSLWFLARREMKGTVVFLTLFVLVLLPWTARNYKIFGGFVPIELSAGHNLYLSFGPPGNEPKVLGHWNWGSDVRRPNPPKGLSPMERDGWLKAQALAYIRANPMEAVIKRIPRKLANLLVPFYGTASLTNKMLTTFCYLLLLALSLPAWWQAWRSENPSERHLAELVLLIAAFTIAFHAIFFGVVRYRYPVDALLLVFAGKSLKDLVGKRFVRG
ncbi:MAG: ArnT family glycosyltransferase [Candidatus Fervidibacter sp.]|uniref:ArnT family glycosyltransferase n=1 Tax=Candidatus Fervidibacter sp. TaxID=3100871 RepID=UPI00404ADF1D